MKTSVKCCKWLCWVLVLNLWVISCHAPKKVTPIPKTTKKVSSYSLSPFRPNLQQLENNLQSLKKNPDDTELQLQTGIIYQTLSPPDRWEFLDHAIALFEQAQPNSQHRPEFWMYLGLSKAAKAKNPKVNMFKKLNLAKEGFSYMDKAIELDANNLSLRLLRAKASLIAPGILGRSESLSKDYTFIKQQSLQTEAVPLHLLAMSYIFLGDHAHRKSDDPQQAADYYKRAVKAGMGTPWEEKAGQRLRGEPSSF